MYILIYYTIGIIYTIRKLGALMNKVCRRYKPSSNLAQNCQTAMQLLATHGEIQVDNTASALSLLQHAANVSPSSLYSQFESAKQITLPESLYRHILLFLIAERPNIQQWYNMYQAADTQQLFHVWLSHQVGVNPADVNYAQIQEKAGTYI
jgi:hypothetical protein